MDELDQKSRSELLQRNEQIKAVSTLMGATALALGTAGFSRWFLLGFDEFVLLWLGWSAALIWAGVKALTMLEAEPRWID
ncbi:MAG: hypothetical protein ACJ8ER_13790 [Allosphingosinicella sp.]